MVSNTTLTVTMFRPMRETSSPLTSRLDECRIKEDVVAVDVAEVVGRQQELTHSTVGHGEEDHCGTRRRHVVTLHCIYTFYDCSLERTLPFGFLAWHGGLSVTNVLRRVIRLSSKLIGEELNSVDDLYRRRAKGKEMQI